jgi:mycofactocin biosynthetic radical S-adenosylmethionine protein MftC
MTADRNLKPYLFSFITTRPERFGALVFNPYIAAEKELDPLEAFFAALCNGHNTYHMIENAIQNRFSLSLSETRRRIAKATEKLTQIMAITYRDGDVPDRPILPDIAYFPEEGPYLSAPKNVIWDITYACNLKCPHCLTDSGKASSKELTTKEAFKLIDKLSEAKVFSLSLSGGEPFIRPDILALLQHLSKTNMRVDIATNGLHIPEEVLMALSDLPVFQVQVSVDGFEEIHDKFRGRKGSFESACKTLRLLAKENIATSISTTVTSENIGFLEKLIDLAKDLGCSSFKALPFLPAGRGRLNAKKFKLNMKGYRELCRILVKRSRDLKGQMNVSTETCMSFLLEPPPANVCNEGPMGCSAGYDTLSIGADGTAFPCPFLHNFPLGNLMDMPIQYIWRENPILNILRNIQKHDLSEPCRSCQYAPSICRGGCRAAAFLENGSLFAPDPNCFQPITKQREVLEGII